MSSIFSALRSTFVLCAGLAASAWAGPIYFEISVTNENYFSELYFPQATLMSEANIETTGLVREGTWKSRLHWSNMNDSAYTEGFAYIDIELKNNVVTANWTFNTFTDSAFDRFHMWSPNNASLRIDVYVPRNHVLEWIDTTSLTNTHLNNGHFGPGAWMGDVGSFFFPQGTTVRTGSGEAGPYIWVQPDPVMIGGEEYFRVFNYYNSAIGQYGFSGLVNVFGWPGGPTGQSLTATTELKVRDVTLGGVFGLGSGEQTKAVPDGGSTSALLAAGLAGLAGLWRLRNQSLKAR